MKAIERIAKLAEIDEIKEQIQGRRHSAFRLGLPRAARLPVAATIGRGLEVPVLLVTARGDQAAAAAEELGFWLPESERVQFPEPIPQFYERGAWGARARLERAAALAAWSLYAVPGTERPAKPAIVLASVRALMQRTIPLRDYLKNSRFVRPDDRLELTDLLRRLVAIGYESSEYVLERGQFAHRGGIVDLWPLTEPLPVRIDFFGDQIDSLRSFDPATQRTVGRVERIWLTPASEVMPGYAQGRGLDEGTLSEYDLPLLYDRSATLVDYLPTEAVAFLGDTALLEIEASDVEDAALRLRDQSIDEGLIDENWPLPYVPWSDIVDDLGQARLVELGGDSTAEFPLTGMFEPEPRFAGQISKLFEALHDWARRDEEITIVSRQAKRLKEQWVEDRLEEEVPARISFEEGTLGEGFRLRPAGGRAWHLLTDSEVFGWQRPRPLQRPARAARSPEFNFSDLRAGDYVVHTDCGVGKYLGLVERSLEGVKKEYLCVEYAEGGQLFVPVYQADRLTRYVGSDDNEPGLSRLGTPEWTVTRQHVEEAVKEVARDLLDLYAKREMAKGIAFPADTPWQRELEASFPYQETEDQLRAIADVKRDMEDQRPMDRLLCGDAGYGKTEVALRAAFKAVMGGKQVAVLVPTTVLAQQHYDTFRQRLLPFPVAVEMLSRFRTPAEQDEIVARVVSGEVDIVIGTHRLLQPDVHFKDLGLVIVDEEQRFGVTHKEQLKKLRTDVDVLTMTATPIPRTLYMALTGVRDISMIKTAPSERLPVVTHVGPYSEQVVRQAVFRELERGGQVFFVHNRVQSIQAMRKRLERLMPDVRIGVAHGQMDEDQLSEVMHQFTQGDIDVLLCTSIIEAGLDIPNANTLIVDRADQFGLASLYQLRGRVGRAGQRAYAYFFYHGARRPTVESLERLNVIAENSQLGAGYQIAMRDLELRGSGDLLGTRQHGYIASVGFHLYTQMLARAVRQMKAQDSSAKKDIQAQGTTIPEGVDASVELPLTAGIPSEYVPDPVLRLQLYRRLAVMHDEEQITKLADEFEDRFGPLPEEVTNLLYGMRVRLLAQRAGILNVMGDRDELVLRFVPNEKRDPSSDLELGEDVRMGRYSYRLRIAGEGEASWKGRLLEVLDELAAVRELA
jgi:transcription-repair coupling factor (superfamily II helicase)